MALAFALLMNPRVLNGLPFHEIAGLLFGVAILTHIGLNFQWVKQTTLKIFDAKLPKKMRFSYLLNILLLISMSTIIITGILISKVVFPNLAVEGSRAIRGLHSLSANVTLVLVGLHIGVHWQWVMGICKKAFVSKQGALRKGVIAAVLLALAVLAGGMQWYSSAVATNTSQTAQHAKQLNNTDRAANSTMLPEKPQAGPFAERHGGQGEFGHRGSANSLLVILNYFLIFAVLIVPAYYLEKRLFRKKQQQKSAHLEITDGTQ
nr:DUF4405 domain-containing protein [Brevibacillus fulvus]